MVKLDLSSRNLITLPNIPDEITELNCSYNQLTSLPVLPPSLQILYCSNNQLTSLPLLPPSLLELICNNNQLTSLPMLPPYLRILNCSDNQLTSLPMLPPFFRKLNCSNNPFSKPGIISEGSFSLKSITTDLIKKSNIPLLNLNHDILEYLKEPGQICDVCLLEKKSIRKVEYIQEEFRGNKVICLRTICLTC